MYAHSPSEIYFFHGDRTSGNADSSNNAYYLLYHHAITTWEHYYASQSDNEKVGTGN